MTNNPKIIDAVSTPATQNVPVKINTSQIEQALKEMAVQAMSTGNLQSEPQITVNNADADAERINPSTFMREMSIEMENLYQRFDTLKALAAEINGMSTDEQLPPQVIFKGLTLEFAINKENKTTDHSVKMQALSCIGDITNLMSNEFGFIIASLRELSKQVADLAQKTNERCSDAFREWESANQNKQIRAANYTTAETANNDVPLGTPLTPITLQAQ